MGLLFLLLLYQFYSFFCKPLNGCNSPFVEDGKKAYK